MLSIHLEVKDFGNKDEMNYETDENNEENMREFCIFIAERKSENTKRTTKIWQANLVQVLLREEWVDASKRRTFFPLQSFDSYVFSTVNLLKEIGFKLLNFLERL